jgi:hypothetical protein
VTSSAGPSLLTRGPAYSVVSECLRIQSSARRRTVVGRVFGQSPLTADARSWYRGALGELRVASILSALGPQFTVLHSVPVSADDSDIDHIVIGPSGVFTINTKNHSGQRVWVAAESVLVNGHRTHHISDARFEASRAARLLSARVMHTRLPHSPILDSCFVDSRPLSGQLTSPTVGGRITSAPAGGRVTNLAVNARVTSPGVDAPIDVTPVIAVVDPGSLTIKSPPIGAIVVVSNRLARTITRRPRVLSDATIAAIVDCAADPETWHSGYYAPDATPQRQAQFSRLRHQVDAAARRRIAWALGGVVAVAAPVLLSIVNTGAFAGAMLP